MSPPNLSCLGRNGNRLRDNDAKIKHRNDESRHSNGVRVVDSKSEKLSATTRRQRGHHARVDARRGPQSSEPRAPPSWPLE